jgi:hypothetical protein
MSNRYKGAVISATPPTTTGGESGTASGAWTLEQQMQAQAAGLWPSQPPDPNLFIENLFSTWLYTGTGSAQTITNGIDFSAKGGLLWLKARNDTRNNWLYDTTRSIANGLRSDSTAAATSTPDALTAFNSNGFSIGTSGNINTSGNTLVSWSFRKQAKFFDVVTYTGTGVARTVAHNLGSTPGCIIVKCTSAGTFWPVYHRSTGATKVGLLNTDGSISASSPYWNDTEPTSSVFTVGIAGAVNDSGQTYVAYLFAHDAGGFGLTGTENVISCGSYTGTGAAGNAITLGYEPQWLLVKNTASGQEWGMFDIMRGLRNGGGDGSPSDAQLFTNTSGAESSSIYFAPTATGFFCEDASTRYNASSNTYVYIAIRRGPMKVPTSATSVFLPTTQTAGTNISVGFPADLWIGNNTDGDGSGNNHVFATRLQNQAWLRSPRTDAETAATNTIFWDLQNSFKNNQFGGGRAEYLLARAPGFMDVVCYTGTGSNATFSHNLTVAPEMMIVKRRDTGGTYWTIYHASLGNTQRIFLNTNDIAETATVWNNTTPTTSVFSVGTSSAVNASGGTYMNYLFSSLAGISKVGSYTGTGALLTVNCGFTSGARFVLIKSSNNYTDWFAYDSARGITSGNDPYYLLNTDAAQVTNTNYVDTTAVGFQVTAAAPAGLNASGGTYIFLAIA